MCGHFFDHGIGKVLAQVAPIAAAFIPGVGPLASAALVAGTGALSSKLQGGSWGDALKSGALSGLAAGAAPILGNAFAGIAPETAGALGIGGGYDTVFGQGFGSGAGGALSSVFGATPSAIGTSPTGTLSSGTQNFLSGLGAPEQISPALASADPSLVATSSGGGGVLSRLMSKVASNPLAALTAVNALGNAFNGAPKGATSQEDIVAQQQAKAAQDAQFSKQTIDMLNSAQSGRAPVVPNISDYYTYGTRPEATFFNKVNTPIQYGALS